MKMRFVTNKETGVVICFGEDCSLDVAKRLGIVTKDGKLNMGTYSDVKPFLISDTYKGVARLAKEDTWDETVGRDVARAKMLGKYNLARLKKLSKFNKSVVQLLEAVQAVSNEILANKDTERYLKMLANR